MDRGRQYQAQGNYEKAGIEFRNALQIMPKSVEAMYMAGRISERQGNARAALGLYLGVIDEDPANIKARAAAGRVYVFAGQRDRAQEVIGPGLAKSPDDPDLLTVRAAIRQQEGDSAGATADAERALKLNPKNENTLAVLASLYAKADGPPRAIALLSDAIKMLPESTDLRLVLANLYATAGELDHAEEQLRKLIQLKPQQLAFRNQLAAFYVRQRKDVDAQRVLEEATRVLPQNNEAKFALVDFIASIHNRGEGEKLLRQYIEKDPDNYVLRLGLGSLLQRAGAVSDAVAAYKEIVAKDEDGPNGLLARDRIAAIAIAQGRTDEARQLIDQVLHKNPRDSEALALRADLALQRNDPTAAIPDLRAVLRDQPGSIAMRLSLARAYRLGGEAGLAEEILRGTMDAFPANFDVRIDLADLMSQTGRTDQALAMLEELVRSAPTDARIREVLIRAYLSKRDFKSARAAAEDLKRLAPKSPNGFYLAGLAAKGDGRLDDSEHELDQALALNPLSPDYLNARAHLDIDRGRAAQAIARVQKAVEQNPKSAALQDLLGEIYIVAKDYPRAVQTLEHTIELTPKWSLPYRDLAAAKLAQKDTAGAIAAYEAGIKAAPSEAELVIGAANLYVAQRRVDDAIARYEMLHKLNPHLDTVSNNLAMLLVNFKTDKASLDRAKELTAGFASSSRPELLDTSGWVRLKRGEVQDAMQMLEKAMDRAPDSRVIRYHLAMAQLKAGERDKARTNLQTALGNSAPFEGSEDARLALVQLTGKTG
jgi:tetratricopeptide (TPR) repeat protein